MRLKRKWCDWPRSTSKSHFSPVSKSELTSIWRHSVYWNLIDAWYRVMAVKPYDLRSRLQLLTWQELTAALPASLRAFLEEKFGIIYR